MDKQTDMKIVKVILFILVLYGTVVLIVQFRFKLKTRTEEYKSYLGKEFVLGRDTLTIINYNQFKYLFVLSNGTKINSQLVFNLGNTVKYISRSGKKSEKVIEDLEKAKWYLEREIINLKNKK